MNGGERVCSKCIHGPTQRECDVREQASKTFAQMPYGGMYCGLMERKPIAARVGSTARRWASEALEIKGRRWRMSELESIWKLRGLPFHGTNGFGNCVTASKETISSIADEIEREVAERFMELPLDADGVPIRVGDLIEFGGKGERLEVTHFGWTNHGDPTIAYRRPNGTLDCSCIGTECRHVKPRTLEDVLRSVVTLCANTWKDEKSAFKYYDVDNMMESGNIADFADEIRAMFGEVDE